MNIPTLYRQVERTSFYKYFLAVLLAGFALVISSLLWDIVRDIPFIFFIGAVVLSAWRGGFGPGMLCAVLSILMADYFLIEPTYTFFVTIRDILQFSIFTCLALLISWLEENRLRSEQDLRKLSKELEVILHSVTDGITAQDERGKVIFANMAAAALSGLSHPQEMTSHSLTHLQQRFELFDEWGGVIPYSALPWHQVFATGVPGQLSFRRRSVETGIDQWIELKTAPVFDDEGKVRQVVNIVRDITGQFDTAQKNAELAAIVENSEDAIIGKKLDGTISSWNPGAERLYGYTAEEAVGQSISIIFPPAIKTQEMLLLNSIQHGKMVHQYETKRMRKDGSFVDVSLTISPIRNQNNAIIGYSGIERDISERRKVEQVRDEQAQFLRKLLDSLPILVGVMTPYGILKEVNRTALEIAKLSPQEVLNKPFEHTYWWAYSEETQAQLRNAIDRAKTGEIIRYDVQIRVGEEQSITIDFMISPMFDSDGSITHLIPAAIDITERKKRADEIMQLTLETERQRRRLNNILSNVPGVIYEASGSPERGEQHIDFISDHTEKMLGYSPDEWSKNPYFWKEIIHPDDWNETVQRSTEIFEMGQSGIIQFRCVTRDGQIKHIEAYSTVLKDADGNHIGACGAMMDITERKQIEEAINQYAEELRRSNEELEQFAYVASHDLQEPLRMVTSYLQLIEKRYANQLDNDAREFIDFAVDGATRMKTLINDLLAYSRVQRSTAEFASVQMQTVVEQVLRNLQLAIEDNEAVITYDDLPRITANQAQMVQLLQNLIGNALKFRSKAPPKIHIGVQRERNHWLFSVHDNGIGIESEYLDRIFVIFQRLHVRDQYPGTGIGLAICKKIVENHSGQIRVESQPGIGTTFYFTIPTRQSRRLNQWKI